MADKIRSERTAAQMLNGGNWDVTWMPIESLTPYARNARKNERTIPYLKHSIEQFGFRVPLVIDKNGVVVTGHTRLKAALLLGMSQLPCVKADDLTPAEADAFRLIDNKISEISEWDFDLLNEELNELKDEFEGDMDALGFAAFSDAAVDDLFDPDNQAKPKDKEDAAQSDGKRVLHGICPCCGEPYEITVTADDETDEELTPEKEDGV